MNPDLIDAIERLRHYGYARSRAVDPEIREVTLTDDEAIAVVQWFDENKAR